VSVYRRGGWLRRALARLTGRPASRRCRVKTPERQLAPPPPLSQAVQAQLGQLGVLPFTRRFDEVAMGPASLRAERIMRATEKHDYHLHHSDPVGYDGFGAPIYPHSEGE